MLPQTSCECNDGEKTDIVRLSPRARVAISFWWWCTDTNILLLCARIREENPSFPAGGCDTLTLTWGLTLFMWTCCWYCFCFSKNCWCCCWMTSWANVLWGRGADCVRFRGLWRGNLWVPLIPGEILSFAANGDWGCKGTPPEKEYMYVHTYTQFCLRQDKEPQKIDPGDKSDEN